MASVVDHARRELELCGQQEEDPAFAATLVATVAAFASYGHSGESAAVATRMLDRLLRRRTLTALTSDPAEWQDRSEMSGYPLWQSLRDPAAMSADGGRTYWFVDRREDGEPGSEAEAVPAADPVLRVGPVMAAAPACPCVDGAEVS